MIRNTALRASWPSIVLMGRVGERAMRSTAPSPLVEPEMQIYHVRLS